MNWGVLAVIVILLIYFVKPYYVTASVAAVTPTALSTVDQIKINVPDPPPAAAPTTVVTNTPPVVVAPPILPAESQIELYTEKNYKGDVRTVRVGQSADFAEMNNVGTLVWKYQSMKVVPGTLLMLTSSVGGSNDRGFLVGKYDVPDLYEVIRSYDNIYDQRGIFMDRTYWARPFKIRVLSPTAWETELAGKYENCKRTTDAWSASDASWGWGSKGKAYCEYAAPDNNRNNYT